MQESNRSAPEPGLILVASDLHLGLGRENDTGRYDWTENFLSDDAFSRFLDHFAQTRPDCLRPDDPGTALLVLNGDTFDFIRIGNLPESDEAIEAWSDSLARLGVQKDVAELRASISKKERRYGLRTDDYKTVWKVDAIAAGHEEFFQRLADWVRRGGRVRFVKGNHDLELHWPLVQAAIRRHIADHGAGPAAERSVAFSQEHFTVGNVYFEHGHRFESMTSVQGSTTLPPGHTELRLPLGSFANRYLVNKMERLEPFLDNIKPVQGVLWATVRRHPLQALLIFFRSLPFLRRGAKVGRLTDKAHFLIFYGSIALFLVTVIALVLVFVSEGFREWLVRIPDRYRMLMATLGLTAPYLAGALRDLFPKRRPEVGDDHYGQEMYHVLREHDFGCEYSVVYACLGHTHAMDVQSLPPIDGTAAFYLNSGTWIPIWRRNRPDMLGRVLFTFLAFSRGSNGEYAHECLEWRPDRTEPVQATILSMVQE